MKHFAIIITLVLSHSATAAQINCTSKIEPYNKSILAQFSDDKASLTETIVYRGKTVNTYAGVSTSHNHYAGFNHSGEEFEATITKEDLITEECALRICPENLSFVTSITLVTDHSTEVYLCNNWSSPGWTKTN